MLKHTTYWFFFKWGLTPTLCLYLEHRAKCILAFCICFHLSFLCLILETLVWGAWTCEIGSKSCCKWFLIPCPLCLFSTLPHPSYVTRTKWITAWTWWRGQCREWFPCERVWKGNMETVAPRQKQGVKRWTSLVLWGPKGINRDRCVYIKSHFPLSHLRGNGSTGRILGSPLSKEDELRNAWEREEPEQQRCL